MNAEQFVAMCERMSPDAQLAWIDRSTGEPWIVLTPIGIDRLGGLIADVESLLNH